MFIIIQQLRLSGGWMRIINDQSTTILAVSNICGTQ